MKTKQETEDALKDIPVISNKKLEQLKRQPIIEAQIWKSQDGKWLVHKTIVMDIKPLSYLAKVFGDEENESKN